MAASPSSISREQVSSTVFPASRFSVVPPKSSSVPEKSSYESTLSTHIRHLREKIEANPSKPVSLVTAKGLGYRINLKGAKS